MQNGGDADTTAHTAWFLAHHVRMASPPFARLLRQHRHRLGVSQEILAGRAGVSARHLSFLENGKAQPSREVVLEIANALDVPHREMGVFLEAAGYVAPYPEEGELERLHDVVATLETSLSLLSDAALLHDRYGNLLTMNDRCRLLLSTFCDVDQVEASSGGHTLIDAVKQHVLNWTDLQTFFRTRLFLEMMRASPTDPQLERLYARRRGDTDAVCGGASVFVDLQLRWMDRQLEFRLLASTLGVPSDVTTRNMRMIQFLPSNLNARELVATIGAVP